MKKVFVIILMLCITPSIFSQKNITIVGVGDIVMGTNYPKGSKTLPVNDGKDLFYEVSAYLKTADIVFGNLEGTLLDGQGTPKKCGDSNVCYAFRMPEKYIYNLKNAGFNLLNIANNHVRDFGNTGLKSTYNAVINAGLYCAGLEEICETTIFTKDGVKYGFCGFAPNIGTVSINDYSYAMELIKQLEAECDIVIVSIHAGAEGKSYNRVTKKREIFLNENRGNPYEFAHMCIDNGADIVLGHGPHVIRAMELYKNRFIAYSLGNFCTPFKMNIKGISGYGPMVKVEMNSKGEFVSGEIVSTIQTDSTGPKLDSENKCIKEVIRLTSLDFPKGYLNISSDGKITKK